MNIYVNKQYRAGKKEGRSVALLMVGFLVSVLLLLLPVFQLWGTAWWIDAIAVAVVVAALLAFTLGGSIFLEQWTLKLEVNSEGLRLRDWRGSRFLPWTEVTAWCAVDVEEGETLICLKTSSAKEPVAISPDLLHGKQFASIYDDLVEHCGPPSPGRQLLGDNDGEPFTDTRP